MKPNDIAQCSKPANSACEKKCKRHPSNYEPSEHQLKIEPKPMFFDDLLVCEYYIERIKE